MTSQSRSRGAAQTNRESQRSVSRGRLTQTHRSHFYEKSEPTLDRSSSVKKIVEYAPLTMRASKLEQSNPSFMIDRYFLTKRFANSGERSYFDPQIFNTSDSNINGAFSSL